MTQILVDRDRSGKRREREAALGIGPPVFATCLLLVAMTLAPACERAATKPAASAPSDEEDEDTGPILIGEFGSMTGPAGAAGRSFHEGVRAAIEECNAGGGVRARKIEVRTYDDRSRPEDARKAVARLEKEDQVAAILVSSEGEIAAAGADAAGHVTVILPEGDAREAIALDAARLLFDAMRRTKSFADADLAAAVRSAAASARAGPITVEPLPGGSISAAVFRVRAAAHAPASR